MDKQNAPWAVVVAAALVGCGASSQQASTVQVAGAQCARLHNAESQVAALYAPGNVEKVTPLYRKEFRARAVQPTKLVGASLYVPAQEGMSEAYLERLLSCHAASGSAAHPSDPLRSAGVRDVDVQSRGQGFVIAIEGVDRSAGKQIWQRAQALRDGRGHVDVEQLATASEVPQAL